MYVRAISIPDHPLRLSALFFGTMLAAGVVAAAALAAVYVQHEQSSTPGIAPADTAPPLQQSDLNLPPGLVALQRVASEAEFEALAGFKPFVPSELPATTESKSSLSVTLPDANGHRYGRVAFSPQTTVARGITGPMIVLMEAQGAAGEGVDGVLKRLGGGDSRAIAATFACGPLIIDAQFYFGPPATEGEPYITSYMTEVATRFLDTAKRDCATDGQR